MKLFSKIWKRNFLNTPAEKLADDVGPLRGYFSFKGFDHKTGLWLPESERQNTLVNQSKTNIIRLISQQQSRWGNFTDPSILKIAYMRFGNNAKYGINGITKHCYYDITELSARISEPYVAPGATYAYPGGKQQQIQNGVVPCVPPDVNASVVKNINKTSAVISDNIAIFTIKDDANYRPPSNNTLVVRLMRNEVILETLYFTNESREIIYTRSKNGFKPSKIETKDVNSFVSTPAPSNALSGSPIIRNLNDSSDTRTLLYYDYNSKTWKLMIEEWINPNRAESYQYNKIRVEYLTGTDNVINSIIPKSGTNNGSGTSEILRYTTGQQDYYSILNNVEYRDADAEFIDDYSCSFAVNMGRQEGNGSLVAGATNGDKIHYKEAFLFNSRNEMFSAIYLNQSMDKDPDISYYVTWTIVAPL